MKKDPNIQQSETIKAAPAKAFFVDMITRDIELQDAILDLLDNCVDGVRRMGINEGPKPYKGYYAHITMNEDEFSIVDNCGGIPLDVAKKYAFMMGAAEQDAKPGMIGVYGIGMKRAIFKMGKECIVHSHTSEHTFEVKIAKEWLEDNDDWNLEATFPGTTLKSPGTQITITNLRESVKSDFADGSMFLQKFDKVIRDAFSLLLEKGFAVEVNNKKVTSKLPTLIWDKSALGNSAKEGEYIRPYIYKATIGNVEVFLAVGFREKPKTSDPENTDAEANFKSVDAGWNVICNDRVVLSYDRSSQTGWGWGGVASYHTQFIQISGFVTFEGPPIDLPMTTTKRGVDANSSLYTEVRERMQEGMKKFIDFTNKWKGEDPSAFFKETASLNLPQIQHEAASSLKMAPLPKRSGQYQAAPHLPKPPQVSTDARISFSKPKEDIRRVATFLDIENVTPSKTGEECFDFVFRKSEES